MIMIVPTIGLAFYISWISRRDKAELFHNLAVCCWISANSTWMIGEFYYEDGCIFAMKRRCCFVVSNIVKIRIPLSSLRLYRRAFTMYNVTVYLAETFVKEPVTSEFVHHEDIPIGLEMHSHCHIFPFVVRICFHNNNTESDLVEI